LTQICLYNIFSRHQFSEALQAEKQSSLHGGCNHFLCVPLGGKIEQLNDSVTKKSQTRKHGSCAETSASF